MKSWDEHKQGTEQWNIARVKGHSDLGMVVAHTCNPGTREAESGGFQVQGLLVLQSEVKPRQRYFTRAYLAN